MLINLYRVKNLKLLKNDLVKAFYMREKFIILILVYLLSNALCTPVLAQEDTLHIKSINYSKSLPDSTAYINIDYPQISGFENPAIEKMVNDYLKKEFEQSILWYNELISDTLNYEREPGSDSYSFETGFEVMFNSKKFLSIKLDHFQYTGGAHGNYYSTGYNISMLTGKSLKLSDIINSDSFNMLSYECEQAILDTFQVSSLAEAGMFEDEIVILPDQDFYIIPGALVLQFDPYEIAPYVFGEINVAIPFDRIKDILKTNLPFPIK